jgi:hypothetical protein
MHSASQPSRLGTHWPNICHGFDQQIGFAIAAAQQE